MSVSSNDVVAFVGGGGKTSAMFRLAAEIVESGGRVITTTTTRIFAAQTKLAPVHVQTFSDLMAALEHHPHVLWTGEVDSIEGKAFGVEPDAIENLKSKIENVFVLIEADGSRMRPFKAPAEHEPVIPECTTLTVPVVGIDAVGLPLEAKYIHRPELVAAIWPGPVVTAEMIARVWVHRLGGRKNVPAGAKVVGLINKVETESQVAVANDIAGRVREIGGFDGVVYGAVAARTQRLMRAW